MFKSQNAMALKNQRKMIILELTTKVRGLLQEIMPTIPDATTSKRKQIKIVCTCLCEFVILILTKKPAQKGQDCLTRAEEVKAMLVKEKANTMAPRPRWHSPRYSSSRALPLADMPLLLSDHPLEPEATLLESEGEGMLKQEA